MTIDLPIEETKANHILLAAMQRGDYMGGGGGKWSAKVGRLSGEEKILAEWLRSGKRYRKLSNPEEWNYEHFAFDTPTLKRRGILASLRIA